MRAGRGAGKISGVRAGAKRFLLLSIFYQLRQELLILLRIEGQRDGLAHEAGHEHGVSEFQAVESVGPRRDELGVGALMADDVDEVLGDEAMFGGMRRSGGKGELAVNDFGGAEALGAVAAVFLDIDGSAGEEQGAVFRDDFGARADDLEAVGTGVFAGGGDKVAGGFFALAVVVLEDGVDFVFDFDGMGAAGVSESGNARWEEAGHPPEEIEIVRALVKEDSAALALPRGAPGAGAVVGVGAEPVGDDPGDAGDLAGLAAEDEFADFLIEGVGALVVHDAELEVWISLIGRNDFTCGLGGDGEGLFNEDVEVRGESGKDHLGMAIMWRGDQ